MRKSLFFVCAVMTAMLVLVLAAGTASAAAPAQAEPTEPAPVQVPFLDEWMASGHADAAAEAFVHWNEDDPAEVPASCAKCHSSTGYQDFLGADGTEAGTVDAPHPVGTVVDCVACHNDVTVTKDSVIMPSGLEIAGLGDESRCMECHQGRESKVSVDKAIADAGVDDDTSARILASEISTTLRRPPPSTARWPRVAMSMTARAMTPCLRMSRATRPVSTATTRTRWN